MSPFTAAYFLGIVAQIAIRAPYEQLRKAEKPRERRVTPLEVTLLLLLLVGSFLLPIVHAGTPLLAFADYTLPVWAGVLGVVVLVCGLFVFWRAHADLGANWSPTLEIREQHDLITRGIYATLRHPMYASQWLWVLAQPLLLHNWIAGLAGLAVFTPFYFLRARAEERLMLETFGDRYREYMQRVGGVLPRPR